MDNPIELREDVVETLELVYAFGRPFTLNIFSLKAISNTRLEETLREHGVDIEEISDNYVKISPRWANLVLYLLVVWGPPRDQRFTLNAEIDALTVLFQAGTK